ncbi:MAG TPA: ATP-grasp domain-containing protein, partial [Caldithrix sp.]|nr:ATP-grasp domain-containing protein [Caldithrix sp.]
MDGVKRKIIILHADIPNDATEDEKDVYQQVAAVSDALIELGYKPVTLPVSLDLEKARQEIIKINPRGIFNLVESLAGTGRLIHLAPALLEFLDVPFSGAGSEAMVVTTNKVLSKERLKTEGIPTPEWMIQSANTSDIPFDPPYIIKPVNEDASVGLDESSIAATRGQAAENLHMNDDKYGGCFVEKYIPGREFNISLLAGSNGPEVLPPAEIKFVDFPKDKPHIVGYRAKWETESFEYRNTVRSFEFANEDKSLLNELSRLSLECWRLFHLNGYTRVDFRVDEEGHPFVLEINANPCISPDSGFIAAAEQAGLSYPDV